MTFRDMSGIGARIVVAEGPVALFVSVAEFCLEPVDVAGGVYRDHDDKGRLPNLGTGGDGARVRAAEESPVYAGEAADPGWDLACLVAACDKHWVETPGSFRTELFELFDDLWRSISGRKLRRRGRG